MPTKRGTTKSPPAGVLPAELRGRYVLTVFGLNQGGGREVRGFDTRAELLDHLADLVTEGKGPRVGPEEVYVLTIVDRERTPK